MFVSTRRKTEIIIIIVSVDFFWVNLECCRVARVSQPQLSFLVSKAMCSAIGILYNFGYDNIHLFISLKKHRDARKTASTW